MSTVTVFKGIKAKKLNKDAFRLEILNALRKEGTVHRQILGRTTTGWQGEKPKFKSLIGLDRRGATVITGPTGTDKAVQKWSFLDGGTRPHTITARNAPNLVFQTGYTASTRPKKFTSRRARRFGPFRRKKSVRHPGMEARDWTGILSKRRKVPFRKRMIAAMQKAAEKAF